MQLSARLFALASMIPKKSRVVDIGTDHAYLPIFLAMRGTHPRVLATEISAGPFARAFACVCEHGMEDRVELRLGDGLDVVEPGEVDVAVMAGMGGSTMVDILQRGSAHRMHLKRLVLQPMSGQETLRRWLDLQGWYPAQEDLIREDDKYYEIIAAEPGSDDAFSRIRHRVGPRLLEARNPLLAGYLEDQKKHWQEVLSQLGNSRSEDKTERMEDISGRIEELEEVLAWLSGLSTSFK